MSSSPPSPPLCVSHSSSGSVTFLGSSWLDSSRAAAAAALNQYQHQVYTYGRSWEGILETMSEQSKVEEGDTSKVALMPYILGIDFWLAKNAIPRAISCLHTSESIFSLVDSTIWTLRERLYFKAYQSMMNNQLHEAIEVFKQLLTAHPDDLFVVKKVQLLTFLVGDRLGMVRVVEREDVTRACSGRPFFHGMAAFALEENDRIQEARVHAFKALEIEPNDVWAVHVMAHIFFAEAQLKEGIEWLTAHSALWSECMSFMYTHNYFHVALLWLDLDEYQQVERIMEQHIWPTSKALSEATFESIEDGAKDGPGTVETSFGSPITSNSFPIHDPDYPEDQNAALNLLWRFDIRRSCLGSTPLDAPASRWFDAHWRSLSERLSTHAPSNLLTLFGILQLQASYRSGDHTRATLIYELIKTQVEGMSEDGSEQQQKSKLQTILLPIIEAMKSIHTVVEGEEEVDREKRYKRAFELLRPIMDTPAPASSSSSSSVSVSASPPPPLSQPAHLSCLSASGEQLELLIEWWCQICVECGASAAAALQRTIAKKDPRRREKVEWIKRLEQHTKQEKQ